MLGIRREFLNANIERVVVVRRGLHQADEGHVPRRRQEHRHVDRPAPAPPTASFEKDAIVFGGSEDDSIKTGIGNSYVDGGGGNDTIVTGDRTVLNEAKTDYIRSDAKAWVAGGGGDDGITVGNGNDRVAGDGTLGDGDLIVDRRQGARRRRERRSRASRGPTLTVPDWDT